MSKCKCLVVLFSLFTCIVNAQVTEEKMTWDYPVKFGTNEWEALKTVEEQFNAYNIPDIYSLWSLSPTVSVCLNIIEKENAELVKNKEGIAAFKHYVMTNDMQFLDSIVELLINISL